MTTEQFSSMDLVCCGKKVSLPKGKENRSVQFEDRFLHKVQDPMPANALCPISYPSPLAPKQRVSFQASNQTPLPAAPLTFNLHFQRPSPPSPLVNTPLSGKRLPILVKMRNMTSIYSRHGDLRRNDEQVRFDMCGGGDSIVSTLLNKMVLKETQVKHGDVFDFAKYTSPKSTLTAYTPPCITYTSPLTISPLGLQSKAARKASDTVADNVLGTNIVLETKCEKKDDQGTTSCDKADCESVACDNDTFLSGWKDNNCATKVDYWRPETMENSSSYNKGALNIIGSKLQTPRQRCPKVEAQKCPKVKYSRGVSTTGALYAFCCRAPYKARVRGVPPNVSVCPQHAICYSKNVSVKTTPKVESLFKFTEEEIATKERNMLTSDDNTRMNRVLLNKPFKSDSKKKETLNVEGKKLKEYSNSNALTDHEPHASQRAFSKNQPAYRKVNQLSLHDDFPFHCFLLFQFEDRKKVMTRLSKLPMRYEQHLHKRQRDDTRVKSTETPKVNSHLARQLCKNMAPKLREVKDEKTASNEYGDGTSLHTKSTDLHEDVGCQQVRLLQQQSDLSSQGIIPPKDNARSSICEVSLEPSSVDARRRVFNRTLDDSFWRNNKTKENSCSLPVEKVLNTLHSTSSIIDTMARTDSGELCVNVLKSGLTCDTMIDNTSFNGHSRDLVDHNDSFEEILDRELGEKEVCLNSDIPNKSESRLLINKCDSKEEESREVNNINDVSQSFTHGSEILFQVNDGEHCAVSDFIHTEQSIDDIYGKENLKPSNCNDLSSEASCLSSKLCDVVTRRLIERNDDGMIPENASITELIEGKSGDRTKDSTATEIGKIKRTYTLGNAVASNNRKYNCMSADVNGAKKALPSISTLKNNSTLTGEVTPTCAQDEEAPSLPIIMNNNCRSNHLDGTSPRKFKGSETLRVCSKLRPKSCFCRTESVAADETIGTACQLKLPAANESSSNKTRCFYSESPDSGISVKSGNSASNIPTEKAICLVKRNRADVKPHTDDKCQYQELNFNAVTQHSSLNSKILTKLDIIQPSSGSNVNVNKLQSGFDPHLSDKDVSAYAGSTIKTNQISSEHYPSLSPIHISSNNMTINDALSNSGMASSVMKFPVCSRSKAPTAKCMINRVELTFKKSNVIPLPKVTSDVRTRSSTEYCSGTKNHRGLRHKTVV